MLECQFLKCDPLGNVLFCTALCFYLYALLSLVFADKKFRKSQMPMYIEVMQGDKKLSMCNLPMFNPHSLLLYLGHCCLCPRNLAVDFQILGFLGVLISFSLFQCAVCHNVNIYFHCKNWFVLVPIDFVLSLHSVSFA